MLSRSWSLTSMAARLCLDAGLHRLNDDSRDPQLNTKKICFWGVYALEKLQALCFGRTSNMQDFDITTSYPNMYPWLKHGPWHALSHCFFDVAKVQSQIYEKLYSAHGRHQNPSLKVESASSIAAEIHRLLSFCKVSFCKAKSELRKS